MRLAVNHDCQVDKRQRCGEEQIEGIVFTVFPAICMDGDMGPHNSTIRLHDIPGKQQGIRGFGKNEANLAACFGQWLSRALSESGCF